MDTFVVVLVAVIIAIPVIIAISHTLRYTVTVKPLVEYVVITHVDGRIDTRGEGTHTLQPGWKESDRVTTSIQESSETGEEVRTINSIRLALDERLNFVAGHAMPPILDATGNPTGYFEVNPDPTAIDRQMVIRASTSIDPGKPTQIASIKQQVKLAVDGACEVVFGLYTDEQLLNPREHPLTVPPTQTGNLAPVQVSTIADLYHRLSEYIKLVTNQSLERIGIGLTSMTITNLRYFDPELQRTIESGRRRIMIAEATDRMPAHVVANLSAREKFLIGDPTFSQVAAAQAGVDAARAEADGRITAARAEADGRVNAARAFERGMTNIANSVNEGVRTWVGPPPPPPNPPTT